MTAANGAGLTRIAQRLSRFAMRRFVAGDTAEAALEIVRGLHAKGLATTLDFLGEETASEAQAEAAAEEYRRLLRLIAAAKLKDCNVSLKLTQFGLNLDAKLARRNLETVLDEAAQHGNFARLDMEGSAYTQRTLDLFRAVFRQRKNCGVVIQAYLKRSAKDVRELNAEGARVRLCKGAYKEPPKIAFADKRKVNASYDALAEALLAGGNTPGLATHDEERIQAALRFARAKGIARDRFEFQMLYGLRPRRWEELIAEGYRMRVYVPYGTHWLPYFMRRVRERKENWLFVLRNLIRG